MVPSKGLYERMLVPQQVGEKDSGLGSLTRGAQPGSGRAGIRTQGLVLFFFFLALALHIMLDLTEGKCEL